MTEQFECEIDFLAVGEGKRNGDAIALRFGLPGNYKVMVYDGGTKESGERLVAHIREHYGTSRVDYVVNSHPDADHASGLSVILDELEVGELWMHQPWNYSAEIREYFADGRMTDASLARRLQEKMAAAYALEKLAEEKSIPVMEPFSGSVIGGIFQVLSPDKDWYVHTLIPEFAKSPEQKKVDTSELRMFGGIFDSIVKVAETVATWLDEHWDIETLREDVETSAENESSVVLFGHISKKGILLTGDAGIRALHAAAKYAEGKGLSLPDNVTISQVPHHGSRHNVSTTALDRILGTRVAKNAEPTRYAIASVGKECDTHPRPVVVNAFIRRGFRVSKTHGTGILHRINAPARAGWTAPSEAIPFASKVESWD